jgi:excisionase family DNA binding protein
VANEELYSWKEIASYLQVTVRTAQKWEKERSLPVHRLPGGRGRILAYVSELEAWKRSGEGPGPQEAVPRESAGAFPVSRKLTLRRALPAASLLVLSIIFGSWLWSRQGQPAHWRLEGRTLVMSDTGNHELWRWDAEDPFGSHLTPEFNEKMHRFIAVEDLDDDGNSETLVVPVPGNVLKAAKSIPLICLDRNGKEKWRFVPGRRVSSGRENFPDFYVVVNFRVARMGKDRPKSILVSGIQIPDYPCQIALLDAHTGMPLREYWHSGHIGSGIATMELWDLDGNAVSEIYLAGANNGLFRRTLVVLDPDRFAGASQEQNPEYQLQGFPPGREIRRVIFPRTWLDLGGDIGMFYSLYLVPDGFVVGASVGDPNNRVNLDYYFSATGQFLKISPGNGFIIEYEKALRSGRLDHSFTAEELRAIERDVIILPPSHEVARRAPPR